jgi:hypothetical protein
VPGFYGKGHIVRQDCSNAALVGDIHDLNKL